MKGLLALLFIISLIHVASSRRRTGGDRGDNSFWDKQKDNSFKWNVDVSDQDEPTSESQSPSPVAIEVKVVETTTEKTTTPTTTTKQPETTTTREKKKKGKGKGGGGKRKDKKKDDAYNMIKESEMSLENTTTVIVDEGMGTNKTILVIDAHYKAEDLGLNASLLEQCELWKEFWKINSTETLIDNDNSTAEEKGREKEIEVLLKESEVIDDAKTLTDLGMNGTLLEKYEGVELIYSEICALKDRYLWIRTAQEATSLEIGTDPLICKPFKVELNPKVEKLSELAKEINDQIESFNEDIDLTPQKTLFEEAIDNSGEEAPRPTTTTTTTTTAAPTTTQSIDPATPKNVEEETEEEKKVDEMIEEHDKMEQEEQRYIKEEKKILDRDDPEYYYVNEPDNAIDDDDYDIVSRKRKRKVHRAKRETDTKDPLDFLYQLLDTNNNKTIRLNYPSFDINVDDANSPILYVKDEKAALALNMTISSLTFRRHEAIALSLVGVCASYVPKTIEQDQIADAEEPIGINITLLEEAGVNLTKLAEQMRNDVELDQILHTATLPSKIGGGSYLIPILKAMQYDPFTAPVVFEGSAVTVRFGVYIESMSNFQTSTMDYDMDIYLIMSWRDPRLINPFGRTILVKEEEILEKIWRPDPFFANAKEAEFHEVTFLNFLMRIFEGGLVLYETRIRLKTACSLILCKYPHDKQQCDLLIKSFAYPLETVRFEWFSKLNDSMDKNPDVKLPELYIDRYKPMGCDNLRKSGNFACLRAVFWLKRDVGFHIAQTYIPTSLALMFSWVGVWLPEEFMEGRIGVAITVLLTLSTESAGAREHLPSVSYLKAIDLWFGFITGFVFFTLLQTLFVIGFDKRAAQLRKYALKKRSDVTEEIRAAILRKAERYHKSGRYIDNFCRVFYPLSFALFLIMYYFVYTEGRQDDCINR